MCVLLSVAMVAAPLRVAFAQTPPPAAAAPPNDSTERMKERFERGQDYYEQRKYEAAAAEFRAAYEIKPAASLLYNEAVCYEKLKRFDAAATLFKKYLNESANPRDRREVEQRIEALENEAKGRKVESIDPEKPAPEAPTLRGVFLIESNPAGANVYLDDKNTFLGKTPWNGDIEGPHTIIVTAQGYKEVEQKVNGRPNQVTNIIVALSQQHYLGWLEVKANIPAADVYFDSKEAGSAGRTPLATNITPGKHKIFVTKEGFTEDVQEIDIIAGAPHEVKATLEKAPIGFVHVGGATVEGAKVLLDGKEVCPSAPCRFQSPSGDHNVTVQKKGLKTHTRKLSVKPASETMLSVRLEKKQARTDLIWKFGFAAAFIAGGVVLGLQANSIKSEIEDEIAAGNPPLPPDDDRFTKGKIFAFAADGLFLVGAITATVAIISLFSEKGPKSRSLAEQRDLTAGIPGLDNKKKSNFTITPAAGPNFAGVAAEVRW